MLVIGAFPQLQWIVPFAARARQESNRIDRG
jgi:hypothetical protein